MKNNPAIKSVPEPQKPVLSVQEVDGILSNISRLYRELFHAIYQGDQPLVDTISDQIKALKAKLQQAA